MQKRVELCRRRADLLRELVHVTRRFVDDVSSASWSTWSRDVKGQT